MEKLIELQVNVNDGWQMIAKTETDIKTKRVQVWARKLKNGTIVYNIYVGLETEFYKAFEKSNLLKTTNCIASKERRLDCTKESYEELMKQYSTATKKTAQKTATKTATKKTATKKATEKKVKTA